MKKRTQQELNSLMAIFRINVDELYEVRHWAKQFAVSDLQLLAAVEQVGPMVDVVRQYLEGQRGVPSTII
jgi:hypothetical protein